MEGNLAGKVETGEEYGVFDVSATDVRTGETTLGFYGVGLSVRGTGVFDIAALASALAEEAGCGPDELVEYEITVKLIGRKLKSSATRREPEK